jgi:hypothetical protein
MKFTNEIQALQVSPDANSEVALVLSNNIVKKRDLSSLYLKNVQLNFPTIFNPITGNATPGSSDLTFSLKSQTRRQVFAAPNGGNGTPDFRALLLDDISDYSQANVNYWTRDVGGTLSFMNGGIALGSTGNTYQSIRLIRDISGNVNSCGVGQFGVYKSDVTSSATNFYSQTKTEATTFVLNSFRHFFAEQYSIGAGSSITNQMGFFASSSLIGAVNNYAFFADIPSGTNRWNFYAGGTARNYFAGKLHIGHNADFSSAIFQVTGKSSFSDNVVIGSNTEFLNTYKLQVLGDGYFKGSKVVIGDAGYTNKSLIFRDESSVGSGIGFSTVTDGLVLSAGSLKKIVFSAGFKAFPSDVLNNISDIGMAIVQNKVGIANLNPLYELDITGSLAYSVLLRPNGNAGTNGQFLKTTGTSNSWASLTAGDLTDFTSAVNTLIAQGQVASNYWTKDVNNNLYFNGSIGIGTSSVSNYNIKATRVIGGAVNSYGISIEGKISSDVTGSAVYYTTGVGTNAGTFNVSNLLHYATYQSSIGAGSSVNSQIAFFVSGGLIGATNNYGFYGDINSGTNRWNLYMNGTASNFMRGKLLLGSTTDYSVAMLQVTGKSSFSDNIYIGSNWELNSAYRLQVAGDQYITGKITFQKNGTYPQTLMDFNDGQPFMRILTSNGGLSIGRDDCIIIGAGESRAIIETNIPNLYDEAIYLAGEGGVRFISSPDNWGSNYVGRNESSFNAFGNWGFGNAGSAMAGERVNVSGSINYSGTLSIGGFGNKGTNGQFLKTTGTSNSWASLTAGDLTDFTSAVNTLIAQGQVASNYWTKTSNHLYYSSGNVAVGSTDTSLAKMYIYGATIGNTVGDYNSTLLLRNNNGNNDLLEFGSLRDSSATSWLNAGFRIQQKIDSTWMAFMQFNGTGNASGISFGTGTSTTSRQAIPTRMIINSSGNVGIGLEPSTTKFLVNQGGFGQLVFGYAGISRTILDQDEIYLRSASQANKAVFANGLTNIYGTVIVNDFNVGDSRLLIGYNQSRGSYALQVTGTIQQEAVKNQMLFANSLGAIVGATASDIVSTLGDSYIKNQTSSAQAANMWISGNGKLNGTLMVGNDIQDAIFRVYSGLAGIRIGYNNSSQNYYDADIQMFRNIAGAEVMRTMSLKLLIGNQSERGPFQLQVAGSALVQDIWIHQGASLNNVFIGNLSGQSQTSGGFNSGFGAESLLSLVSGTYNTAIGAKSSIYLNSGAFNTTVGVSSGYYNQNGNYNCYFGYASGETSFGSFNVSLGAFSMHQVRDNYSVAIGHASLQLNGYNTSSNIDGYNVAIGYTALRGSATDTATNQNMRNIAIGAYSLLYAKTVTNSIAIGMEAMVLASNATHNVAIGYNVMYNTTTGSYNVAFGSESLKNNTTGSGHTAIGMSALKNLTTGDYNVGLGTNAGTNLTNGGFNLFLGAVNCGLNIGTGSANVIIGSNTGTRINGLSNYMIFSDGSGAERFSITNSGYMLINRTTLAGAYHLQVNGTIQQEAVKSAFVRANALGALVAGTKQDFTDILGDDSFILNQTATAQPGGFYISGNGYAQGGFFAQGNVSSGSDRRIKSNIMPLTGIANRLGSLELKSYLKHGVKDLGYIAQDLQEYFPDLVTSIGTNLLGINYGGVASLALQLGKENNSEIEQLKKEIQQLKNKLNEHGIAA